VNLRHLTWRIIYLGVAGLLVLVDQLTKFWARDELSMGQTRTVIDGFLDFAYAENTGIAFSQFSNGGEVGRWLLVSIAVIAAAGVLYYFFTQNSAEDSALGAGALLLAGIVGNVIDRIRLGYVIDFIDVHIASYHWPTFNVADSCITVGVILVAIKLLTEKEPLPLRDKKDLESQI
jgi:signal peptidase II